MAAKDGSNGAWRGDTMGVALLLSLLHFMCLANKKLESPGITKVRGFRRDTMGVALLLSLLHFMCLANKKLESPGITKVRGFRRYANLLVANDEMLIKTLRQALPLQYCIQQIKSLCYYVMPFQSRFSIQT